MSALTQIRTQTIARWQALSTREQRSVSVLGALLTVLLLKPCRTRCLPPTRLWTA